MTIQHRAINRSRVGFISALAEGSDGAAAIAADRSSDIIPPPPLAHRTWGNYGDCVSLSLTPWYSAQGGVLPRLDNSSVQV
jgi:hypothetical protein